MSKIIENAKLALVATCIVSFIDTDETRHAVKVEAEGLYEAAVLAIRLFRQHGCEPGPARQLEIEVRTSIIHTITRQKVDKWVNGGASSPRDMVLKQRLRSLL